ncbi:hypothetical protein [Pontibacillus sp. HMF3514]|nr:hypothetical protein [Pontibacillus sp. HMF3514]QHE51057.1 hypothetical protein GS400_02925 [Pontibacillus sp. HMF3514]
MLISAVLLTITISFTSDLTENIAEVTAKSSDDSIQMMYDPTVGGVG